MAEYQQIIITNYQLTVRIAPLPAIVSAACGVGAMVLAAHYPLWPMVVMGLVLAFIALSLVQPALFLLLPAMLPVIGLAPWTGWITFEELDMLVLATGAGAYGHMAWRQDSGQSQAKRRRHSSASLVALIAVLFALSTAVALARGLADAGGFVFGWFQGYHEPMNSIRLAKSFFLALLLLPPWQFLRSRDAAQAQAQLTGSLVVGLAVASLTTVWERVAFPGLLNFSADYRTTGMFWEMHVGGAALDGFLALTAPFAIWALLSARSVRTWSLLAAVLALAAYACLTTFSRGVYLAIPIGSAIVWALHSRQRIRLARASERSTGAAAPTSGSTQRGKGPGTAFGAWSAPALVFAFGAGAAWMFPTSGYRGMAALLATAALALPMASVARGLSVKQWLAGVLTASALVLSTWAMAWAVPKGAYMAWLLAAALTATTLLWVRHRQGRSRVSAALALGGFVATASSTGLIALHWGETDAALHSAIPVLLALLAIGLAAALSPRPLWPDTARWQGTTVALMTLVAATIAVFGGGAYMGDRFSTGERDLEGREAHWRLGVDMLRSPGDWLLGKGLGRYPANYFLTGQLDQHPGDYRLKRDGENSYLTLSGGLHTNGWSEIFRVTQRIAEPGKATVATARVRAERDVELHFEICEKHLLYGQNCAGKNIGVKGTVGVWQDLHLALQGAESSRGDWYAPRLIAFSIAMETKGGVADLDNLTLHRADGRELLSNGDFSTGMTHWFFSSDKYHLPWHMKNMFLHLLFDQGLLGAALVGFMLSWAIWRASFGAARNHPLAPAVVAGLAAFAVVGLFDSLLDVPRLALLFYLILFIGLLLPRERSGPGPGIGLSQALRGVAMVVLTGATLFQHGPSAATEAAPATRLLRVGPNRDIRSIAEAARLASNNTVIEVDAGDYVSDVAVWTQDGLALRAVGGRVQLIARGASAEGKAIWVVRGKQFSVDGFDFSGTEVPDHNGAGIRLESGSMRVSNCRFIDNENGILTSNRADVELDIVDSEFGHNGYGDGQSHNLYVGAIARLSVTGSYFHHAIVGHLLKSRAAVNDIRYNRLTDGPNGRASYELEFPNGGVAYVVGNIIEQGPKTENPNLISYGAEAYRWPRNALYLVHNTLIDEKPGGGVLLRVKPGDVTIQADNNLLIGPGQLDSAGPGSYRNNVRADWDTLEDSTRGNYSPRRGVRFAGKLVDPGSADGLTLRPAFQYRAPMGKSALVGKPHNPGALQSSSLNSRP